MSAAAYRGRSAETDLNTHMPNVRGPCTGDSRRPPRRAIDPFRDDDDDDDDDHDDEESLNALSGTRADPSLDCIKAWGMLKNTVYNDVPTTQENMRERILNACASINSEMIERVRVSFVHRIRKCIEVGGHHFEHLLK
ncbi:hypothetical protein X777_11666 [Ooceraea biroi]|uniref:Uncharacterized protein n=1 Tax=Ooceraea biroi TaxID=2015173 RepID=A0A026W1A2_OOCBI|nr:hypothetical protein X777_11666 [Ooceraea biroi]